MVAQRQEPVPPPLIFNMTLAELGQAVKAKYPQYAKVEDAQLGQSVAAKYPQYGSLVSQGASKPAAPQPPP